MILVLWEVSLSNGTAVYDAIQILSVEEGDEACSGN